MNLNGTCFDFVENYGIVRHISNIITPSTEFAAIKPSKNVLNFHHEVPEEKKQYRPHVNTILIDQWHPGAKNTKITRKSQSHLP